MKRVRVQAVTAWDGASVVVLQFEIPTDSIAPSPIPLGEGVRVLRCKQTDPLRRRLGM